MTLAVAGLVVAVTDCLSRLSLRFKYACSASALVRSGLKKTLGL